MQDIEETLAQLRRQGCRITPQRLAVLQVLAAAGAPLGALEIWRRVRLVSSEMSLDTVYRNLALLVAQGVALPIGALGKEGTLYEWGHQAGHHHHIRCVDCGRAACLEVCPVDERLEAEARRKGYQLLHHSLDLFGRCEACRLARGEKGVPKP